MPTARIKLEHWSDCNLNGLGFEYGFYVFSCLGEDGGDRDRPKTVHPNPNLGADFPVVLGLELMVRVL
jgi:hypothetical protein